MCRYLKDSRKAWANYERKKKWIRKWKRNEHEKQHRRKWGGEGIKDVKEED